MTAALRAWLVLPGALFLLALAAFALHTRQQGEQALAYACGVIAAAQQAGMPGDEAADCRAYRLNAVRWGITAMADPDELTMQLLDEGRHAGR